VNNLNGAMPLDNSLTITGNRNGDFNNSLVLMQNNNTGPSAAPALRVVNGHPAGRSPEGALSVSANVVSSASDSIIARFGNYSAWVLTITNDGSIYSAGDVYARGVKLTSDRNAKDKFTTVDSQTILEKVAALPMSEWDYKDDPGVRHLGPVAQDFHAAFGLNGSDDTHISVVDEGGVALAAIQGLNQKLEQKEAEITELKQRMELLESLLNRKLNGGAK
jgi:hypothetical protein